MEDFNLKLENVKLHTELQNLSKEQEKQKLLYKKYITDLKNEYENNKKELDVLKYENETLKYKLDKLPKIIKKIFIGSDKKNVKLIGESK